MVISFSLLHLLSLLDVIVFLITATHSTTTATTQEEQHRHQPSAAIAEMKKTEISASSTLLNESCRVTLYPEFCISFLSHLQRVRSATTEKEIVVASVTRALRLAKKAFAEFNSSLARRGPRMSRRQRGALRDCVDMMELTVFNLGFVLSHLRSSSDPLPPANSSSSESWRAREVRMYLGAAMTDHNTCMESFSELKMKRHLKAVKKRIEPIYMMVSNSLDMVNDYVAKEKMHLAAAAASNASVPATKSSSRRSLGLVLRPQNRSQDYNASSVLLVQL